LLKYSAETGSLMRLERRPKWKNSRRPGEAEEEVAAS
jgi:hypothetical protein